MKFRPILAAALLLAPSLAFAHPGHHGSALHLHLGIPATSPSLDLGLACAALVLGCAYHGFRVLKKR
ncbi:MAG: hypothetical protein RLZZ399_1105 [Verrucomicrobiota bacterium]|jgi:hypothetical protein